MRRALAIALLSVAVPAAAEPSFVLSDPVRYHARGVRCDINGTAQKGHDTIDGEVLSSQGFGPALSLRTAEAPAQIGLSFGVVVSLKPSKRPIMATASVSHPPMGPQKRTVQTWPVELSPTQLTYLGYALEDEFELLPGLWTFRLHIQDRLVFQQSLTLRPRGTVPRVQSRCALQSS